MAKLFLCALRGCPNTVSICGNYCPQHQQLGAQVEQAKHKQLIDHLNSLPQPWKQLYQTPEWRKLRSQVLAEQPVCVICGKAASTQVHHTIVHSGNLQIFFDRENLIGVCESCHKKESMKRVREGKKHS